MSSQLAIQFGEHGPPGLRRGWQTPDPPSRQISSASFGWRTPDPPLTLSRLGRLPGCRDAEMHVIAEDVLEEPGEDDRATIKAHMVWQQLPNTRSRTPSPTPWFHRVLLGGSDTSQAATPLNQQFAQCRSSDTSQIATPWPEQTWPNQASMHVDLTTRVLQEASRRLSFELQAEFTDEDFNDALDTPTSPAYDVALDEVCELEDHLPIENATTDLTFWSSC